MSKTPKEHKCLIAGVGRSGTTFLVELLTELGLDTGFSDSKKRQAAYFDRAKAGLEINPLLSSRSPYIVKDPRISDYFDELISSGRFAVDHVFIPIRDLEDAAMSRITNTLKGSWQGGLWKTSYPDHQKPTLAETLYSLFHRLGSGPINLNDAE
jgi:hypothetical protein